MAQSITITEIQRALCILKKGWENIEMELNAHSEDLLLLVNSSVKVMLVFLPRSLVPQGSKLSAAESVQAPGQNTEKGTGDI